MDSSQTAQALIDYVKLSGAQTWVVDVIFQEAYRVESPLRDEDRLWVLNNVLAAVRRGGVGDGINMIETTCQQLYNLARANRSVPGGEFLSAGIAEMADRLMRVAEETRKQHGIETPETG